MVMEVIVNWYVWPKDYREELHAKCIFDGCEEGVNVWDDLKYVLPLCCEPADEPSICRVREAFSDSNLCAHQDMSGHVFDKLTKHAGMGHERLSDHIQQHNDKKHHDHVS